MKFNSILILASAFLILSCDKKEKAETSAEIEQTKATDSAQSKKLVAANAELPAQTVNSINDNASQGLNPEHGQPNHRCDIAVGAPLNSAPQSAPQPQLQPQVVPQPQNNFNTSPTNTMNASPKPALNPEHGQPHHRCDLEVGAPLS